MISRYSGRRALKNGASLGGFLLLAACSSLPSIGPNTATGLPTHVDGGAGQVLRFCEKMHDAGDLTTAAATCERAHRLNPSAPEPLLELASILGEMGESDLSIEAYRTILKTSPANADAHYGLGRSYLNRGQHDLALTEFQAALRSNPKDPLLYKAVGVASGLLGAHAEAQRVFREGLLVAPEDAALRNNLGLSLVQSGRYDEGLLILESLAKNPGAEQVSHDNLLMAQGLAATARAEIMLAEVRAKEEAEANAAALAAAQAEAQRQAEGQAELTPGKPGEPAMATSTPAALVSSPQSSWPMDGPGEDGVTPIGNLASKAAPNRARQNLVARALSKRSESGPVTAPTALTKTMAPPPAPASTPLRSRPARAVAKTRTQAAQAPRSLTGPKVRQTARADLGDTSDAGAATANNPGTTAPSGSRQRTTPTPAQLVAKPPQPGPPPTAKSVRDTYTVQFASYTSEERAWRGWDSLRGAASSLLSNIEPDVRRADLGGDTGTVYRLQTEPAPKRNAKSLCSALKAEGVECLVIKSEPEIAKGGAAKGPATL